MSLYSTTLLVTALLLLGPTANAETIRIDLKDATQATLATRQIDLSKSTGQGVTHVENGYALEVKDPTASCGVYLKSLQASGRPSKTSVMVSLIENSKTPDLTSVKSNSGVLSKVAIPVEEQDVTPKTEAVRKVSVESSELKRSCSVTVL